MYTCHQFPSTLAGVSLTPVKTAELHRYVSSSDRFQTLRFAYFVADFLEFASLFLVLAYLLTWNRPSLTLLVLVFWQAMSGSSCTLCCNLVCAASLTVVDILYRTLSDQGLLPC